MAFSPSVQVCLAFAVVCALVPCAHSVGVSSATELINVFKNLQGDFVDTEIELLADLNFSFSGLSLPLGVDSQGNCVPFNGTLHGNGHNISSLVMNVPTTIGSKYKHAGLFCSLGGGARIENLLIDSSCSFSGYNAGALSPVVTGSITVVNVINRASISATAEAGGFIGRLYELLNTDITIVVTDCVNDGNVVGGSSVGGFIGYIACGGKLVVSNFTNNGEIGGGKTGGNIGGFAGYVQDIKEASVLNYSNNGFVSGSSSVGGVIGLLKDVPETEFSGISNVGNITGDYDIGGFIGNVDATTSFNLSLSNCINSGNVTADSYAAGFVGVVFSPRPPNTVTFSIVNGANTGAVMANNGKACGIFCVGMVETVFSSVRNSINKGDVSGNPVYGIADNITLASNVVSMGDITVLETSYTFWKLSSDVSLFYGKKDQCVSCTGATLFTYNANTGFYEVDGSDDYVHNRLNKEAEVQQYGMMWSKELQLVEPFDLPSSSEQPVPSASSSTSSSTSSEQPVPSSSTSASSPVHSDSGAAVHSVCPLLLVLALVAVALL